MHGRVIGDESIDRCDHGLFPDTERILATGTSAGLFDPTGRLTLVTHSGSEWEIAYQSLDVDPA